MEVEDGRIISVSPGPEPSVNQGALCSKGRYGFDFVHHRDRLTTPLVRKDGELVLHLGTKLSGLWLTV